MSRNQGRYAAYALIGCMAAVAPATAMAQAPAPIAISGGAIDPTVTDKDIYIGVPVSAKAPPECRAAEKYLEYLNSGQAARMAELYADDAVAMPPMLGKRAVGKKELERFYGEFIGKMPTPKTVAVSYVAGGGECYQAIATLKTINGKEVYVLGTVDLFRVNPAGKITSMMAFQRPRVASEVVVAPK